MKKLAYLTFISEGEIEQTTDKTKETTHKKVRFEVALKAIKARNVPVLWVAAGADTLIPMGKLHDRLDIREAELKCKAHRTYPVYYVPISFGHEPGYKKVTDYKYQVLLFVDGSKEDEVIDLKNTMEEAQALAEELTKANGVWHNIKKIRVRISVEKPTV